MEYYWGAWGGPALVAILGGITSAAWWVMQRHIARVDEHSTRIADLERNKAGWDDLEGVFKRMESASQRSADQTNARLDRIYELLAQYARGE